jgi:hypothetical protein
MASGAGLVIAGESPTVLNLDLLQIRTAVAQATSGARLRLEMFTVYEAQRRTNPELFVY